ncbi:MAG: glycosyl transferase family 2 [Planctomycetaceae bacterium]|nr:glycosyl transferase family 2 [Planctomycetaceae bacterium]
MIMSPTIIVVPCFNEELRLPVESFRRFVALHPEVCFLMVNDGSQDQTLQVLKWLKTIAPDNFLILNLPVNQGKAEAVRQGCLAAFDLDPEYIGYWDADLAAPLEAMPQYREILDRLPDIDLVIGSRLPLLGHTVERGLVRYCLGRLFAWSAAAVLGLRIYDTQCGHKLFRNSAKLRQIFHAKFHARWIFDVELFARWIGRRTKTCLQQAQGSIYELPLESWHDVAGSKLKPFDFFRAFFELANIAWVYAHAPQPVAVPEPTATIPFPRTIEPAVSHRKAA